MKSGQVCQSLYNDPLKLHLYICSIIINHSQYSLSLQVIVEQDDTHHALCSTQTHSVIPDRDRENKSHHLFRINCRMQVGIRIKGVWRCIPLISPYVLFSPFIPYNPAKLFRCCTRCLLPQGQYGRIGGNPCTMPGLMGDLGAVANCPVL